MRVLIFLVLLAAFYLSEAIRLGNDGGYDLVLELKDIEKQCEELTLDPLEYVDNIQRSFEDFSMLMWNATNQTFWIRSVEIIIPPEWEADMEYENASDYSPADIKISSKILDPYVSNPVLCGLPGDHIDLPLSFFDLESNVQKYGGNISKPLMVLWARYRWGVWEEHGNPDDIRFPYFFKNFENKPTLTGCNNNTELEGVFRNKENKPCDLEIDPTCRFHPNSKSSVAKSSLMHFYWLDAVTEFCDSSTHQKHDPNTQNLFCDRKSALEVILKSADFKLVTNKTEIFVYPTITIASRFTQAQVLYLLIDSGFNEAVEMRFVILGQILDFISSKNPILGLGYFPTNEADNRLQEVADFKLFSGNENIFLRSVSSLPIIQAPERDFGNAILQAADLIREISPEIGGTILLLKTGRALDNTTFPYEKEMNVALRQEKINLFGIEILDEKSFPNLNNLAIKTVEARKYPEVNEGLRNLFDAITQVWDENAYSRAIEPVIIWKGQVKPNETIAFPVPPKGTLAFNLITSENVYSRNIVATIDNKEIKFNESVNEYGETRSPRYVYTSESVDMNKENSEATFRFTAYQPAYLVVTSEGNDVEEVKIQITTSIANRTLNLFDMPNEEVPFGIYAHLTFTNGTSIAGARVSAEVTGSNNYSRETISLRDDGWFTDITAHDGIYSGVYVPRENGNYSLRVTAVGPGSATSLGYASKLLPQNQYFDSADISVTMPFLTKTIGLRGNFEITNRSTFYPVVTTIRDLEITDLTDDSEQTELQFNLSPARALGETNLLLQYNFYSASSADDLLKIDLTSSSLPPGVELILSISTKLIDYNPSVPIYKPKRNGKFYFAAAVLPFSGYTRPSKLSNIVSFNVEKVLTGPPTKSTEAVTDPTETYSIDPNDPTSDSTDAFDPETPDTTAPPPITEEDSKPWIKKPAGIATITTTVVIFIAGILIGGSCFLKKSRAKPSIKITVE